MGSAIRKIEATGKRRVRSDIIVPSSKSVFRGHATWRRNRSPVRTAPLLQWRSLPHVWRIEKAPHRARDVISVANEDPVVRAMDLDHLAPRNSVLELRAKLSVHELLAADCLLEGGCVGAV